MMCCNSSHLTAVLSKIYEYFLKQTQYQYIYTQHISIAMCIFIPYDITIILLLNLKIIQQIDLDQLHKHRNYITNTTFQ